MSTLFYVGTDPTTGEEIISRLGCETLLNSGVSRGFVDGQAITLANPKATKSYVDTQDALFADSTYYGAQDAALVPLTQKGVANGVATLTGSPVKIPVSQTPVLGVGFAKQWGPTSVPGGVFNSSGSNTNPVKVVSYAIGVQGMVFQPIALMSALVLADVGGRPIIEAKIGTPSQTAYVDQTLIAQAVGRTYFGDYQSLSLVPGSSVLSADGTSFFNGTTNWTIDIWLRDESNKIATLPSGNIVSTSLYLMRTAL